MELDRWRCRMSIHRSEMLIGKLLRYGVIVAGLVIGFGWVLSLAMGARAEHSAEILSRLRLGESVEAPLAYHSAAEFGSSLASFQPNAWMTLGIAFLIALPILRVALTIGVFWSEKDRIFVALSSIVFAILMLSLFLGKAL